MSADSLCDKTGQGQCCRTFAAPDLFLPAKSRRVPPLVPARTTIRAQLLKIGRDPPLEQKDALRRLAVANGFTRPHPRSTPDRPEMENQASAGERRLNGFSLPDAAPYSLGVDREGRTAATHRRIWPATTGPESLWLDPQPTVSS